jgi:hypothetical protein
MLTRYINLKKDQLTTVILTNTKKKILLRVLQGVSTIQCHKKKTDCIVYVQEL